MFKKDKTLRKKKWTIIIRKIFIILSIILVIYLPTGSANAYVRPEFKDGLAESWHPAGICIPCHYMLGGTARAQAISSSCDSCHSHQVKGYTKGNDRKIQMSEIENIHKDMVCIRCHVGLTSQSDLTAADFHRVMSKTACLSCHTFVNGTYKKPLKTRCSDCHSASPHVAHGKKIEKLCVACHGELIEKFITRRPGVEDKIMSLSEQQTSIQVLNEYPTIGTFIMQLIEEFTRILR